MNMDLVRVDWIDPEGNGDWEEHAQFKAWAESDAIRVVSFGLLAFEGENHIVIVQSYTENQVRSPFKIPRICIRNIERIQPTTFTL